MAVKGRPIGRASDGTVRPRIVWLFQCAEFPSLSRYDRKVPWTYPSLLRCRSEEVCLDHHFSIELLVFEKDVLAKCISDALLLSDRIVMKALACRLEGFGSSELERLSWAYGSAMGQKWTCIGIGCIQTLLWRLVLWPYSELLWRNMLRFLLISKDVRLDLEVQWLINIGKTYETKGVARC